jgi:uridylate kinase
MSLTTVRRVLLKISGELLQGKKGHGLCFSTIHSLCLQLSRLPQYQFALVMGGGNFFRGREGTENCPGHTADSIGMLATVMNGLAMSQSLTHLGIPNKLLCARSVEGVGEPFDPHKGIAALEQGEIVICSGGLGHGVVTTDTASVLRGIELDCDMILKGTKVQGIYSANPDIHKDAIFYPQISYAQALDQELNVMDSTALTLAKEHKKPIIVFSLKDFSNLGKLFSNQLTYTLVHEDASCASDSSSMAVL